jgi:magnesium-protoporphyrin IX monomethyl ester (oxidative) cyclase
MRNYDRDFESTTTHDVLFICMPWMAVEMPSLPLSILSAYLMRAGIDAGVFYPNLEFSRRIGVATYGDFGKNHNLFGDWAFARLLHELTGADDVKTRAQTRPSMDEALPAFALRREISRDQIAEAIRVADEVPAFLGWCREQIDWNQVKLIGFSTTLMQLAPSLALASQIKSRHPDVAIIMGGSNCRQPMGSAILKTFSFIDSVVCGEADEIMVKLARRILDKVSPDRIPNVLWRNNNQTKEPSATDGIAGVIDYPPPNHDDYFKALATHPDLSDISPRLPFEASRGCWWANRAQCRFCGLNGSAIAQRLRPLSRILEELRQGYELYGSSQFVAMDNVLPRQYTPALAQSIKKQIPNARLYCEIRPEYSTMVDALSPCPCH